MKDIVAEHWADYGRNYYSRHDYEEVDADAANAMVKDLRDRLPKLKGEKAGALTVAGADDFAYHDPVDGSDSEEPGHPHPLRGRLARGLPALRHRHGGRDLARLYRALRGERQLGLETQAALADLIAFADGLADIDERTGRAEPSVIT